MLKDLAFISTNGPNSKVDITFRPNSATVQNRDMLIQMIVKRIFTQRGSNSYDSEVGTNFPKAFGTVDLEQVDAIEQSFPVMIRSLQDQIKALQSTYELEGNKIPDGQRLVSLSLDKAEFDKIFGGWILEISVETRNSQFTVTLP